MKSTRRARFLPKDQQALIAAKKWLFRPAKKDGVAVPVRVMLELSFRLH